MEESPESFRRCSYFIQFIQTLYSSIRSQSSTGLLRTSIYYYCKSTRSQILFRVLRVRDLHSLFFERNSGFEDTRSHCAHSILTLTWTDRSNQGIDSRQGRRPCRSTETLSRRKTV